jgi:dienelactone hydrolase
MTRRLVLALAVLLLATAASADGYERVTFPSRSADGAEITGFLLRPADPKPAPAVVALHGCNGLFNTRGELARRHIDWGERFLAAGYVVLFPDSFRSRGLESVCDTRQRRVVPRDRGGDATAAADWLADQAFVDRDRIALVGWSNGGSSVLWARRLAHCHRFLSRMSRPERKPDLDAAVQALRVDRQCRRLDPA